MGQEAFQFQTAPEQFYTTSYENEIAYVTPDGSHQNTEFINNNQLVQPYKNKTELVKKPPVSGGLWFFFVLIAVWQIAKIILKKCHKAGPVLLLSLLCCESVAARDVVWKYSFLGQTIRDGKIKDDHKESRCSNKTLYYYNTLNTVQRMNFTKIENSGLKLSNRNKGGNGKVDIIEESSYSKISKITIKFEFLGISSGINKIHLRDFSSEIYNNNRENYVESALHKTDIRQGDSIWSVNINDSLDGILIHFTLKDSIILKSIEIEYEDTSNCAMNNYKFYDGRNELVYAFADTATDTHTLTADTMPAVSLRSNDWIYTGWSGTTLYDDATATPITSIGGSAAADTVFHAIYSHTRKAGSPIGTTDESRYYSRYCITDTVVEGEGYEISEDVTFPDGVRYKMSDIDDSRFYYFSLPFDCPLSHIKFSNDQIDEYVSGVSADKTAYIGDWLITYWDESTFSWVDIMNVDLATTVLSAGRGYGIGIVPKVTTDVYFLSGYSQTISPLHNDTIPISFTYPVQDDTSGCHSGWNFMGSRLWQPIDHTAINTSYVLIANTGDLGWTLYSRFDETLDSLWTIKPFSTFMVQTNRDLTYTISQPQAIAAESFVDHFNLVIRQDENPERMDYTTIVSGTEYSDEYEIGMDMSKMLAQDVMPQIFSVMDSTYYAINASEFGIGSKIKVGIYVPHKEDWIISLGRNINIPAGWHIILKDNSTGVKKDLTVEDYQFSLKKGFYPNRFDVEISDLPLIVEDIDASDVEPEWMRIVSVSGIVMYEGGFDWTRLEELRSGVYVVVTEVWTKKMIVMR